MLLLGIYFNSPPVPRFFNSAGVILLRTKASSSFITICLKSLRLPFSTTPVTCFCSWDGVVAVVSWERLRGGCLDLHVGITKVNFFNIFSLFISYIHLELLNIATHDLPSLTLRHLDILLRPFRHLR